MSTKQQAAEYQKIFNKIRETIPQLGYGGTAALLNQLHRYETILHRIAENDCNGHPRMETECRDGKMYRFEVEDDAWAARDAKHEESIRKKVFAILDPLGIKVQFNGDPRGGAIRFVLPSGASNNWDHETWGIYW